MKKNIGGQQPTKKMTKKVTIKRVTGLGIALGLMLSAANIGTMTINAEEIENVAGESAAISSGNTEAPIAADDSEKVAENAAENSGEDVTAEDVTEDGAVDESADEVAEENTEEEATEDTEAVAEDAAEEKTEGKDAVSEDAAADEDVTTEDKAAEDVTANVSADEALTITYFANNEDGDVLYFDADANEFVYAAALPISKEECVEGQAVVVADLADFEEDGAIEKDGFVFIGWAKSADATEADFVAGDEIEITASVVLYGVWADKTVVPAEVVYFVNGATFGSAPQDDFSPYAYGDDAEILYPWGVQNDDLTFLGWSTDPFAKTAEYTFDENFQLTVTITGALRLYAVWGN